MRGSRTAPRSRRRNSPPTIPEKIARVRPSFPSLPRRNAAEGPGQALRDPVWGNPTEITEWRPHIARFLATCQLILRRGTPRTGWDPGTPKISRYPPSPGPGPPLHPGRPDPDRLLRPASPRTHEVDVPRAGPDWASEPDLKPARPRHRSSRRVPPGGTEAADPALARPRDVMGRPKPPSCLADASQTGDFRRPFGPHLTARRPGRPRLGLLTGGAPCGRTGHFGPISGGIVGDRQLPLVLLILYR